MPSIGPPSGRRRAEELASIRRRSTRSRGPRYWRSLEELADSPDLAAVLREEFPREAAAWPADLDRRGFLRLAAASMAMAGLGSCVRQPEETIVPYVRQPEHVVPGEPLWYSTALTLGGYARGVLVESHGGRPTKVEGHPDHPASLGATDVQAQAQILDLYDPDRSRTVTLEGRGSTSERFVAAWKGRLADLEDRGGEGLALLTRTVTSPTVGRLLDELQDRLPGARWHQYEPVTRDAIRLGARRAFGDVVDTHHALDRADAVLLLDADPFGEGPARVRRARDFFSRRDGDRPDRWNRLYSVESTPSPSGAQADHRLTLPPSGVARLAAALAARLGIATLPGRGGGDDDVTRRWVDVLARDLRGRGAVIVGDDAPPSLHVLGHALDEALGNVGGVVRHSDCAELEPTDQGADLRELVTSTRRRRPWTSAAPWRASTR